jgi:hypothetical protein
MKASIRGSRRARLIGLGGVLAILTLFIPAFAGIALAHHSLPVVLQVDCDGNVNYSVYDWASGQGGDEQATDFKIEYTVDGGAHYIQLLPDGHFGADDAYVYHNPPNGDVWVWTGSFTINPVPKPSLVVRAYDFTWVSGASAAPGYWDSLPATWPSGGCHMPAISTTIGGNVVLGSGVPLTDTATLSGGTSPTGLITFKLYDPTSTLRDTETATVNGDKDYPTPTGFVPDMVGTWYWVASYGGDPSNNPVASGRTDEPVVVSPASPTITTKTGGTVVLGSGNKLTDTATLAGGYSPTGLITFKLYDPTSTLRDTETATVNGDKDYPTPTGFVPDMAGTWQWVASYGGDGNNTAVASAMGDEPVVVSKAGPTIATTLSKSRAEVGTAIHDSATLTGVTADASGTVKYTVFSDAACSAGTQDAGTVNVTNGSVSISNDIIFNNVGTWYWQAVYSGDGNNAGATSACTEETLVIDPTPGPSQTFSGETATPTIIIHGATGTPFVPTPPPTNSGDGSSNGGPTPLFPVAICLLFAGIGLLGVQSQLRSMRR